MDYDKLLGRCVVPPGTKVSLAKDFDPADDPLGLDKSSARELLRKGIARLAEFQDKLYAQDTFALLIILQAMDAAGKDGMIKHVMTGVNPQGVEVHSFKAPSTEELDHDYLWRCSRVLPERGRIGIFNRSYYEEVLVLRVHPEILTKEKLTPEAKGKRIWKRRFEEINNFEQYLVDNGIIVLKFFLNVSKEEQKRRFLDRIDRPEKNWKFSVSDVRERAHWDEYQKAYEDCLQHTSTKHAPWYVIPADSKAFARVAVTGAIYQKLKSLKVEYPTVNDEQRKMLAEARKLLESEKK